MVRRISICRLLNIIGLFCKRALSKRLYSAKKTSNFKEPIVTWSDVFHTKTKIQRIRVMTHFDVSGVATISRLLQITGLFCKRALWNRLYSVKDTSNFKEPTNRSHPISHNFENQRMCVMTPFAKLTNGQKHITGWRRLIGSPKLQIIFHQRATKYRSLLRKMTYKDKGSYECSPPCISLLKLDMRVRFAIEICNSRVLRISTRYNGICNWLYTLSAISASCR